MFARLLLIPMVACLTAGVSRATDEDTEKKAVAALQEMKIFVAYELWEPGAARRECFVDYRLKHSPGAAVYEYLETFEKLRSLKFIDSPVTDADFKHIGRLKPLTYLGVFGSKITGAGVKYLAPLKKLRQVDFTNNPLEDVVFDGLAKLPNLTTINLEKTRVTGAGLEKLADHKKLWFISLARTPVTDAGIKGIGAVASLTDLELSGTDITDESVPVLSQLTKLEKLDVTKTRLTLEGLQRLHKALPKCAIKTKPNKCTDPVDR